MDAVSLRTVLSHFNLHGKGQRSRAVEGAGDPDLLGNDHVDRGYPALEARPQALSGGWGVNCLCRAPGARETRFICQMARDPRALQDSFAQRDNLGFLAGACR